MRAINCLRRILQIASYVLVFTLINGCAARQAQPGLTPVPGITIPDLPAPDALVKGVSETVLLRLGREYDPACAQNLSAAGDDALFAPSWAGNTSPASALAYGLYRLNLAGYAGAPELHLVWSGSQPAAGMVYAGLSNWVYNRWDWFGVPDDDVLSLPGPGFAPYINGGVGETLVVVMCLGEEELLLHAVGAQLPPPLDYWPMYQHDAQHTGRSTHIGPATDALKWKFEDLTGPGSKLSSPAIGPEGQVYAGGYNDLYAYNADGSLAWKTPAGNCSQFAPAVAADGTVYVGSSDMKLYAFNPDGTQKWAYTAAGTLDETPAVASDGTAYFSLADVLYAIKPDGTLNWSYDNPSGAYFGSPTCGPADLLYVTSTTSVCKFAADGTLIWEYSAPLGASFAAPVVDADGSSYFITPGGTLVALAADGTLRWMAGGDEHFHEGIALDADHHVYLFGTLPGGEPSLYSIDENGNILWQVPTDSRALGEIMVNTDGAVVYGEGAEGETPPANHHLHAMSAAGSALWTTQLKGALLRRLAQDAGGNIYCTASLSVANAGYHSRVYALNSLGTVLWASGTGGVPAGTAVVGADGRVYSAFDNGNVFALNPDGTVSWMYETDGSLASSSPAVADDGTVYVPSLDGRFIAINDGGTLAWEYAASYSIIASSPTLGPDGAIYYGDYGDTTQPIGNNGVLTGLNPDGSLLWSTTLDATIYASVSITPDNTKYVAGAYGDLRAYDASGVEQWQLDLAPSAPQYGSVAIADDGTLYTGGPGNSLIALNPDGTTQWTYPAGGQVFSTPALGADGTVYFGTMNNKLYALHPDGTLAWEYPAGGAVYGSPIVDGAGRIYFGSWSGYIFALNADGTLAWSYPTGGEIWSSPSIGLDGTVYVGSNDGGLYAIGPGEV